MIYSKSVDFISKILASIFISIPAQFNIFLDLEYIPVNLRIQVYIKIEVHLNYKNRDGETYYKDNT